MTRPLSIALTPDQLRDFTACAEAAGLAVERWIVECAQVQAANVIDAVQATERRRRAEISSEPRTAQIRERRRARTGVAAPEPTPAPSETMRRAQEYNARFRRRT